MPALIPLGLAFAVGFVPIGEKHGVHVYQRPDAPLIELAAEGEIDAAPSEVQAVLLDPARQRRMIKRLAEHRVLARSDGEMLVYQRLNLPVVSDRDYVEQVTWGASGATRFVHARIVGDRGPPPTDAVRMPTMDGYWELAPVDGGRRTHARYTVTLDFGGSVPRWMVRGGAAKDLPKLFEAIRRELQPQVRALLFAGTEERTCRRR